jgi:hypothetical protein
LNNGKVAKKKGEDGVIGSDGPTFDPTTSPYVDVFVKQTALDPSTGGVKFAVELVPGGTLDKGNGKLTRNISLEINSKTVNFNADSRMEKQEVTVGFIEADPDKYPFDVYAYAFAISGSLDGKPLHITGAVAASLQGWTIEPAFIVEEDADESRAGIGFGAKRSLTTLGFSIFCAFLLWALALATLVLTLSFIFFPGSEAPPLPVYVAMLFALPAVRSNQPGVPAIGASIDLMSFFWCMGLISLCTIVCIGLTIAKKWNAYAASLEKN